MAGTSTGAIATTVGVVAAGVVTGPESDILQNFIELA